MRFSLIVATLGRVEELRQLLLSLEAQTFSDFEVIIIDQNADDRLSWVTLPGRLFRVIYKRSTVLHSSHARNLGLQYATGDIVAFPDDDCIYPPQLLSEMDRAFRERPDLCVRTGPAVTSDGAFSSGRWQQHSSHIDIANVWTCAIEFNIFVIRCLVLKIGGFDERLGVGGIFGSSEGNDLVLRAVEAGGLAWYDIKQTVVHPDKTLTPVAAKRAFVYGAGCGYVLRKHRAPAKIWLNFMIRALGGFVVCLARGKLLHARYYLRSFGGRLYGFLAYHRPAPANAGPR